MAKYSLEYFDGESIELEFSEGKHTYLVGGKYVPSVTTILGVINKPALMPWAAAEGARWFKDNVLLTDDGLEFSGNMSIDGVYNGIRSAFRKKSEAARGIGTIVHSWCEAAINFKMGNGDEPELPADENAVRAIEGFNKWVDDNAIEWISSEEKLYHREHNYAGTVDAVANINGEFCVVDFKTSTGIWDEYFLQCAAYAEAVRHVHGEAVEGAWILRFDKKTGEFEAAKSKDIAADFKAFLGAQELHYRLKELKDSNKRNRSKK